MTTSEETDLNTIEKMPWEKWQAWRLGYYQNKDTTYKHLRLGQAFINENYPQIICPRLFYAENAEAATIIRTIFVDWSTQ